MFEVSVQSWFSAAHQLQRTDGSLEPLHGHNWHVTATLRGSRLDAMGVLVDFTKVGPALQAVLARLHDRNLNELPAFRDCNPSAENVAVHVAESIREALPVGVRMHCVAVEESPGCVARWYPD